MGMRAQVYIKDTGVYLYTHWGSEALPVRLQEALNSAAGYARRNDPEYLARIIFDYMKPVDANPELSFGIGTKAHTDLEYPPIVVDCENQTVTYLNKEYSFEDFINLHTDDAIRVD